LSKKNDLESFTIEFMYSMAKQSSLLSFFSTEKKEPPLTLANQTQPIQSTVVSAKECLEPHFIRPIPPEDKYSKQLELEYELIDSNSFTPVFLQVKTILKLIEEIGTETKSPIPHIIRGSAGSSLVCFLLGITHIDPLKYGIQLARFMNVKRKDIPDIDIDVPYNRRDEIYERIAKKWPGMLARISNHVVYSSKTALREAATEVLGLDTMPANIRSRDFNPKKILSEGQLKEAQQIAHEKLNTLKNYSLHCGGFVLFEKEGKVPDHLILKTIHSGTTSFAQLTLNKDQVEDAGFIKIDLLSNRGLAQIADIEPNLPFTQYPARNFGAEHILEKGLTIGITFGESRGMRKLFMAMKPVCVKDIAIALALIRPAAAAEGRKQEFLDKWKLEDFSSNDPLTRPIVFDDDAIVKIRYALKCSSAEADSWRKFFAKGNQKKIHEFRTLLYKQNIKESLIEKIIDDLNQLVYYSFCKSHAISYAQLVWALAYWKWKKPHEFWVASLNHCHSEYRKWVHYREARCSGLLLSRSPPPYKLGTKQNLPALLSSHGEQSILLQKTPVEELKELGYWTHESFLPGCGVWRQKQTRLDGKIAVKFCGLIACGRSVSRDGGNCTLLCIGIENKKYIDLIIPDKTRGDLFRYSLVEGSGILKEVNGEDSIEVDKIFGKSLSKLK
jgi:DNA polymerase III alpha subunit